MPVRSILAVAMGAVLGFLALIAARLTAGLVACPDPDPLYSDYLVDKGLSVHSVLCANTHAGVRPVIALAVICGAMLAVGIAVGHVARNNRIVHAVASVLLLIIAMGWVSLFLGRLDAENAREMVLFSTPAIIFAGIGGYVAKTRHA